MEKNHIGYNILKLDVEAAVDIGAIVNWLELFSGTGLIISEIKADATVNWQHSSKTCRLTPEPCALSS